MNYYLLVVIFGLTLITVVTRSAFLILGDYIALPDTVQRALRYAPACALVAIVVPDLVTGTGAQQGQVLWTLINPKLFGALMSIVVLHKFKNILASIAGGLLMFWLIRWLITASALPTFC